MTATRPMLAVALTLALAPAAEAAGKKKGPALPAAQAQVTETAVPVSQVDDARTLAEEYLKAISREGGDAAIEQLLGGATLTARIFTLENWKIVGREKHRHEEGDVADLHAYVNAIDKGGRDALAKMMGGGPGSSAEDDGLAVQEITAEDAVKILGPTKAMGQRFNRSHPVFAYIARVEKQVYWHPKNPFRKLLADAGAKGRYEAEFDLFWIETVEGRHEDKNARKWPLRVVRFQANGNDTGMKILPASDWNAE